MIRTKTLAAAVLAIAVSLDVAIAQQLTPEQAAPSIKLAHPGSDKFYVDFDYAMSLTNEEDQKQIPNLKKYLFDPMLVGVDGLRPLRIDTLTGGTALRYLTFIPVSNLDAFRKDNLEAAGINSRKLAATLYRLSDDVGLIGFMQYQNKYANIGENRGDVPTTIADPRPDIQDLVSQYDLTLDIQNAKVDKAAMQVRRKQYDTNLRKALLSTVKQTQLETDDQFALRTLFTEIQVDELGRVYVDAKHARLGLILDEKRKDVATMDIVVDPLPETELAASFQLLAQKPSEFANVPRTENTILSARINHPLDEMRQKNFARLSQFLREQAKEEYDKEEKATAEEKTNRKKAADIFFDMVDAGLKSGIVDAFAEGHPNESGKNTVVGGIVAVDGNALIEALKLYPKASQGQKVELNVDEVGGVKIHKFTAATKNDPLFNDFLGVDELYVGTADKAVWYAGGENALAELKGAIEQCGMENTGKADDPVADIIIKLGPWMKLRQASQAGKTKDEEILKLRQLAVDAFIVGDDKLTLNLKRVENQVEGLMTGQPGILRFVGKLLADFSKKNLED